MKQRRFGKTGKMISEIGLGTWQLAIGYQMGRAV